MNAIFKVFLIFFSFILIVKYFPASKPEKFLILQSTTSTRDSGLYDYLLPKFKLEHNIEVRVIAVGTGQAIKNSMRCDGDLLIVHHKESEEKFIDDGFGLYRMEFMYNDYVLVGPRDDPAKISMTNSIVDSLLLIKKKKIRFVSRGDDSGTHKKEIKLWALTNFQPDPKKHNWYFSVGQGMGGSLNIAVNKDAYILSDRSTWLSFNNKKNHKILVENEPNLYNFYGVIPINPEKCPDTKNNAASKFIHWLNSNETKDLISSYKVKGQQLFFTIN
ncbi:MAG: sulfate transporter [Rickettsiales bacterium]|nr:sulfate transporter [Rickettsiales bacterium]